MKKFNRSILLIVGVFLTLLPTANAQNSSTSPYSRYGIGELFKNNNQLSMAMGGTSIALRSKYFINSVNPASYTAFDSLSFVFDGAFYSKISTFKDARIEEKATYASMGYLSFGFPVLKHWRTSIGILPYSDVGYVVDVDSIFKNLGKITSKNSGTGGLNKIYWGNGFSIAKNLSVGLNLTYIFGTINKEMAVLYPPDSLSLNSKAISITEVGGFITDLGFQYQIDLKNNYQLTLGLVYSPSMNLKATSNELQYTYIRNPAANIDQIFDTVFYRPETKGEIKIPQNIGLGANIAKGSNWDAGIDFQWQDWSKYTYFDHPDNLQNSMRISLGGKYTALRGGNYFRRINYRGGVRFERGYLSLENKSINNFGVSFGVGFPLSKLSSLSISIEYGSGGTIENRLIKESFFRCSVGISFYDKWFIKRKYD